MGEAGYRYKQNRAQQLRGFCYAAASRSISKAAQRMGLSHHVGEGAILDFAGRLDATKPVHRITAWVLLVIFGLPVVLAVMRLFAAF